MATPTIPIVTSVPITVLVTNPTWLQKETSIDCGDYYKVASFGVGKDTRCQNIDTNIDAVIAMENAKYGLMECRVNKPITAFKSETFEPKNDSLVTSLVVAGVLAGCLLAFGASQNEPNSNPDEYDRNTI